MLEVVIETSVWQSREQGIVALAVEHILHVDMVERLVPNLRPVDCIDDLLLDRFR
jgi:hypothetical protein